ncbi:MAG TPA: geranylgeranylglyceryl/heptaprenylglyceryl phosphate synthase [Bacteroidia bacterium]|nr:geranylgeranylglyceryl/heptaprenylglyceryl phosphate synthase [Bacteroidia bacterium]
MLKKTTHTQLIILIDPDKYNTELIKMANHCRVNYIFVGGSVLQKNNFEKTIKSIKSLTKIPVIIFPGDETQISKYADGILILSLLSGRNAEYLVGKHIKAASKIKASKLKPIPTGYILVAGDNTSTTQKVTKTKPLVTKKEITETAIAGELLGKQLIYLEAGSGAKKALNTSVIKDVKKQITIPLIVGGGINSVSKAKKIIDCNPDYIVIGNALEINPNLLMDINKLFL